METNRIIQADCLKGLSKLHGDSVDLIYLDPPFNTNKNWGQFDDRWEGKEHTSLVGNLGEQVRLIARTHSQGQAAYIGHMAARLVQLKRVLKRTGSIYLHCDNTASHYLKAVMDIIFGASAYEEHITWKRTGAHNDSLFADISDTILWYGCLLYTSDAADE